MRRNEHGRWRILDLLDSHNPPVLTFQAPSTWGLVIFPKTWEQLIAWERNFLRREEGRKYTAGAIPAKWLHERGETHLISPLMFEYWVRKRQIMLYFWLGRNVGLAVTRDAKSLYMHDSLFNEQEHLHKLGAALHAGLRLPSYSVCHGLIKIRERDEIQRPFNIYYPVTSTDRGLLSVTIAHLINNCRKSRIRLIRDRYSRNDQVRPVTFECSQESGDAQVIFDRIQGDPLSVSCNHSTGLLP